MVESPASAGAALTGALARKPGAQARPGQDAMCVAVEAALAGAGHLLVEAPTGTGKSLAYLVPAVRHALSGPERTVVVVTATKALQEQLVGEDLPFLTAALDGPTFDFAMLKGRSNYLCWAKLDVTQTDGVEGRLDFGAGGPLAALEEVAELGDWAEGTPTGDRADAPKVVSDAVWSQVSVDPGECPGAAKCHAGDRCFAETARMRAANADVVVVNAHLYASHIASGGYVLPPHDAVVFDEAHTLEDVFAESLGVRMAPGRVRRVASRLRGAGADIELSRRLERAAGILDEALSQLAGTEPTRVTPTEGDLAQALGVLGTLAADAAGALRRLDPAGDAAKAKVAQAGRLVDGLAGDVVRILDPASYQNQVAWVERFRDRPELHLALIDVGPVLAGHLYPKVTVVATSATLATGGRFEILARRLGLSLAPPPEAIEPGTPIGPSVENGMPGNGDAGDAPPPGPPRYAALAVPSPFDHPRQGFLYVARHLPEPNDPAFTPAMHEELHGLIGAAGGRTLALFTSRAAMERAATALEGRGGYEVIVQDRMPRPELLARFRSGPGLALFATQSFWQGVDLPGSLCHLVTIDRVPFPRPTDPLIQARREAAEARGANAFSAVDIPLAATLLAQGAGRLIRTTTDRGVVAVFDRRLATRAYRATLLATMPSLRRTVDRDQVLATLAELADGPKPENVGNSAQRQGTGAISSK
ncbi:MAG: ATP-dependent DNA helicase [Acidimicrobiia bacterium]